MNAAGSVSRRRVLRQWRRCGAENAAWTGALELRSIKDLVATVVGGLELDRRRSETRILQVWQQALDPTVVAHAQPVGLRSGTLFVAVDSSVWLSEIVRYRRFEILERLQESFGREALKRISFRLG